MSVRIHVERALQVGETFELPSAQARHVQVVRLQPGDAVTLFDGAGGEAIARVLKMGRADVTVHVEARVAADRELQRRVIVALGMPANERMDAFVEKATELGVAEIQPLVCERSVLRLSGERAEKRVRHWKQVAVGASEQCGRTRVPIVAAVQSYVSWLGALAASPASSARRIVLDPEAPQRLDATLLGAADSALLALSGPEGGLSADELAAARAAGFAPASLGARVLRADTAPLVVLAWCGFAEAG